MAEPVRYRTIVADPPWEYGDGFPGGHSRRAGGMFSPLEVVALPYPSMTLDDIRAMPVASYAEADCRLFLWTTNRYLPAAFDVLSSWSFTYRQTLVWNKLDANLPASVAPNSAEFVIVATRGKPARCGSMPSAVVTTARGAHSAKPDCWMDHFENVSPGPYLELFARRNRLGWDTWGNECLEHACVG